MPVIPFGVGSSLEGHLLAVQGGISIDVSRMNRVLQVNPEDLTVMLEPGVTREQLNREIRDTGLFFPIDPARTPRWRHGGHARQRHERGALRHDARERARPDGRHRQRRGDPHRHACQKSSAGYDLTRLMVGSEGTLGVITEITLKALPIPRRSAAVVVFDRIESAVNTTIQMIQLGLPIARCELLDVNAVRGKPPRQAQPARGPMLLMEFHGSEAGVKEQAEMAQQIARENGGEDFQWATTPEERTRLDGTPPRLLRGLQMKPGCRTVTTDTCVPISRLTECISRDRRMRKTGACSTTSSATWATATSHRLPDRPGPAAGARDRRALNDQLVHRALAMEGTLHRRARHRPAQAGLPGRRAGSGRSR